MKRNKTFTIKNNLNLESQLQNWKFSIYWTTDLEVKYIAEKYIVLHSKPLKQFRRFDLNVSCEEIHTKSPIHKLPCQINKRNLNKIKIFNEWYLH